MGKLIDNPFALNPSVKFGLSPGNGVVNHAAWFQRNTADVRGAQRDSGIQQYVRGRRNTVGAGIRAHDTATGKTDRPGKMSADNDRAAEASPYTINGNINQSNSDLPGGIGADGGSTERKSGRTVPDRSGRQPAVSAGVDKNCSDNEISLNFTEEDLLRGFIMSEILGRPKCFRNGR